MSKHQKIVHKYIGENPISKDSKALILGTIYPSKDTNEFMCDYFYGNDYTIWEILKNVFPSLDIYTKEEMKDGFKKAESAIKIKNMLNTHKIAISDTISETERDEDASQSDDKFSENTRYNVDLIEQIKDSDIETIYFTSIIARQKFSHIYTEYIKSLIDSDKLDKKTYKEFPREGNMQESGSKFIIENTSYFERKIECVILPSPSDRALASESNLYREENKGESYEEWLLNYYKKVFSNTLEIIKYRKI